MLNTGTVNCYFHADRLNKNWCVNCGKPICSGCSKHSYYIADRHPVCPQCVYKRVVLITNIIFPNLTALIIFILTLEIRMGLMAIIIFLIFIIIFFVGSRIYETKSHRVWDKTRNDRPIPQEEIRNLIDKGEIGPCALHPQEPSIDKCDQCGIVGCVKCIRIRARRRYTPSKTLCMPHYWKDQSKFLILYSVLFFTIPLTFVIVIGIIIYPFSGGNHFMQIMALAVGLPFFITGGFFFAFYLKLKWEYLRWQNELASEKNSSA